MRTITACAVALAIALGTAACGPSADTKGKDKKGASKGAAKAADAKATDPANSAAARPAQGKVYTVVGVVKEIDTAEGTVALDHEPVSALNWAAATHTFSIRGAMLPGLAAGQKVEFEFVRTNNENVVTSMK